MIRNSLKWGGCVVALVLCLNSARAGVVFSNFGAGDTYDTTLGYVVGPDGFGNTFVDASRFTATGSGTLSTIELALSNVLGNSGLTVELHADAGGTIGALLASGSTAATGPLNSTNPLATASMSAAALNSGTPYWVVVSSTAGGLNAWNFNSISDVGPHATSLDGGSTFAYAADTHGAFRVNATTAAPTPEPGTLTVFALGAVGLAAGRRLRRRVG